MAAAGGRAPRRPGARGGRGGGAGREVGGELAWYRGGPLADLDDGFRASLDDYRRLGVGLGLGAVRREWERALDAAAERSAERTRFHSDLLARTSSSTHTDG